MNNKPAIVVVLSIALTVFVLAAIWSGVNTDSSGYSTATAPAIEAKPAVEPMSEPEQDDMMEEMTDEAEHVVEAVTEQVEAVEPVIEQAVDVVEQEVTTAVEEVVTPVVEETQAVVEEAEAVVDEVVAPVVAEPAVNAEAQVHIVTAEGLKYNPLVTVIAVGDTVAWENMSSHDTQAIEGLVPEGAELWHSGMGENYQHTFTVEGIYVYKCTPHFGAGMGGVIIVGNPTNLDAIKAVAVSGAAKRLVKKAIKAAEAL